MIEITDNRIISFSKVPGFGTYFVTYEWFTRLFSGANDVSSATILTAGGLAGIVSWVVTYPIDVVKTRLQVRYVNYFIFNHNSKM